MKKKIFKILIFSISLIVFLLFFVPLKRFSRDFFSTFSAFGINKRQINQDGKLCIISDSDAINNFSSENQQLRQICKLSPPQSFKLMTAEIVFRDPRTWNKRFIINRGEDHGVRVGAYLVSLSKSIYAAQHAFSIAGRVVQTSKKTSEVATIFDREFSVSVFIGKANVAGILLGGDEPRIEYFNPGMIENGINYLKTSKFSLLYPPFIPVGTAIVENSTEIFKQHYNIQFEAFADLYKTDFLTIIIPEDNDLK